MKIAILSDIHGNNIAFNQCLDYLDNKRIKKCYFLGDSVGYYSDTNKIIDELRKREVTGILGNHDAMLTGVLVLDEKKDKVYRLLKSKKEITKKNFDYLKTLKFNHKENIDGFDVLFVHGSSEDNLNGYIYSDTDITKLNCDTYDIVFMGHTHHPFITKSKNTVFVNVGSIGLPRDIGNWLSFGVFDTEIKSIEVVRLKMNVEKIEKFYIESIHTSVINVLNRNNKEMLTNLKFKI